MESGEKSILSEVDIKPNGIYEWVALLAVIGAILFLVVLLTGSLWGLAVFGKEYGNLGEFITGVTSPFLTLATVLLLYGTYKMQKKEMKDSDAALRKQMEVSDKQMNMMQEQMNQKTFFDLLDILYKSKKISCSHFTQEQVDVDYFSYIETKVFISYKIDKKDSLKFLEFVNHVGYTNLVKYIKPDIERYFIALNLILEFTSINTASKIDFLKLFRSTFTQYEKNVLEMCDEGKVFLETDIAFTVIPKLKALGIIGDKSTRYSETL